MNDEAIVKRSLRHTWKSSSLSPRISSKPSSCDVFSYVVRQRERERHGSRFTSFLLKSFPQTQSIISGGSCVVVVVLIINVLIDVLCNRGMCIFEEKICCYCRSSSKTKSEDTRRNGKLRDWSSSIVFATFFLCFILFSHFLHAIIGVCWCRTNLFIVWSEVVRWREWGWQEILVGKALAVVDRVDRGGVGRRFSCETTKSNE